jgi:hypothetical protein
VALAGGRGEIVEPLDLLGAQLDAVGCRVLLEAGDALGAGDRGDVLASREQPGRRDLRRCGVNLGSDGLDLVDDAEVLLEVPRREARVLVLRQSSSASRWACSGRRGAGSGRRCGRSPAASASPRPLLPRYFQTVRHVSATHSGLLIYPLMLGLLVAVNVAAPIIVRRLAFRGVVLCGYGIAALGALGFATFDASTPDWRSLILMGLLGVGIGPALSGLQIALTRSVAPQDIGAALGTLLLGRQIGGAIALAAAETVYRNGLHSGHTAAVSTGAGVVAVGLAGALIAALALASLPRGAGRLPQLATAT